MIVDREFIDDHIESICDVIEKWDGEDDRLSASMRKDLAEKVQKDLKEYFDEITDEEQTGVTIDIDFFDTDGLAEEIIEIIQDELGLEAKKSTPLEDEEHVESEDEECTELEKLQENIVGSLEKLTDSYSFDEIIEKISTVGLQCAESSFDISEDQKQSLLKTLMVKLDRSQYESARDYFGDGFDDCSSETSLDMDSFSEDELTQVVEQDIDTGLKGSTMSEADKNKLKNRCGISLHRFCKELDRMACYDNLA